MKTTFRAKLSADAVDADAGTLRGVSVVTAGKVNGLDMTIDRKSLEQFRSCGLSHRYGLKVQTENFSGFDGIVGAMTGFRIEGDRLRGDISLLASHPARARIIETASKLPEQVGLSVAFVGTPEVVRGEKLVRCSQLYSVGFTDAPSANPAGLFSHRIESMKATHIHFQLPEGNSMLPGKLQNIPVLCLGGTIGGAQIDDTTLEQFVTLAEEIKQGFIVSIEGIAGFSGIIGKMGNVTKTGHRAVADIHLLRGHPAFEYVISASRTMQDLLAIRVSVTSSSETVEGQRFARISAVEPTVAIVHADKANPNGFFGAVRPANASPLSIFESLRGEPASIYYREHRAEILADQFNRSLPR